MFIRTVAFPILMIVVSAPPALAQTEICVPQFLNGASGGFTWRTMLVFENREQTQAQVQLRLFNNNGTPLQQLMMMRRGKPGQGGPVGPNGQFSPEPLRARTAAGYCSTGEGGFQAGSVMVQSQSRIQVHARLQLHDPAGNVVSETAITPGPAFRKGWFFADRTEGVQCGLALVNPAEDRTTVCTAEILADDGVTLLGSTPITLGPHSQTAQYLFELFPQILTGDVSLIRITCTDPVCALSLYLRGLEFFQIPVVIEDPS